MQKMDTEQRTCAARGRLVARAAVALGVCALAVAPQARVAGAASASPALAGQLVRIAGSSLTIQAQGGTSSIATAPAARYYAATAGTARALAVGETVAVNPQPGSSKVAGSVAIAPSNGTLVAFVMQLGAGGRGGPGGSGPGNAGGPPSGSPPSGGPGSGAPGGPGGDGDNDFGASRGTIGKVTALTATSITLRTSSGAKTTLGLGTSTTVFRFAPITRSQLRTGRFVAMRAGFVNGALAAKAVVEAPAGAVVVLGTALGS